VGSTWEVTDDDLELAFIDCVYFCYDTSGVSIVIFVFEFEFSVSGEDVGIVSAVVCDCDVFITSGERYRYVGIRITFWIVNQGTGDWIFIDRTYFCFCTSGVSVVIFIFKSEVAVSGEDVGIVSAVVCDRDLFVTSG